MPSEREGFGHSINEGRAAGAQQVIEALLATEVQALQGAVVVDSLERARWGMDLHADLAAVWQQQQQQPVTCRSLGQLAAPGLTGQRS